MAGLFSLPIDGSDSRLDQWKNKACYCSSSTLSQKDMLAAILSVTGDKESDWTIKYEPLVHRYKPGQELLQKGDRAGFMLCMVTRVFSQNDFGDNSSLLEDEKLGIAQEDVNRVTREAVELAKKGYSYAPAS